MQIEQHVERALGIARALEVLRSDDDVEVRVELLMLACTHLLTAILHHDGITNADVDQVHAHHPAIMAPLDHDLERATGRLGELEAARALLVRGDAWDADDVTTAGFDALWPEFLALAAVRGLTDTRRG